MESRRSLLSSVVFRLNKLRLKLATSSIVRNSLMVGGGTVAAQLIAFAFVPLITRIYTPEQFGVNNVFLSVLTMLAPVAALRYPMAIVIAKTEADVDGIKRVSIVVGALVAVLALALLLIWTESISAALGLEQLGALVILVPVALFFTVLQERIDYQSMRLGAFRAMAATTTVQAAATNVARVVGGLVTPAASVLVVISTLAPGLHTLLLRIGIKGKLKQRVEVPDEASAGGLLATARRYGDFAYYRAPTDLLASVSQALPVVLLSTLFSPAIAGLYGLARSVLNIPSVLVGRAVGHVLYARYAEMARAGTPIAPLTTKATLTLVLFPGLVILLGGLFAPPIFDFVFGADWREAGVFAAWMSLWIVFTIGNVPVFRAIPVIRRQRASLIWSFVSLLLRTGAILGAYQWFETAIACVAAFSLMSVVTNLVSIVMFTAYIRAFDKGHPGESSA